MIFYTLVLYIMSQDSFVLDQMSFHTTKKRAIGPGQGYQLLLQPVPMVTIGTGCNSSWYLWPSTDLVEGNWHRVVVPTGSNASP